MIEINDITKKYADFTAVYNLNLTVRPGEVFGFIGPNGAGKTTTIKILGGILDPTTGTAKICGIDIIKDPVDAKRKIGFVPDRPYLYEKLTGMEFMRFTADLYGVELIESYSHGMRQRLIFASALIHDPEVIIVDEPMVGLDPLAIMMVKDLFRNLAKTGVSVFMSTHTLKVAEDICDRIGIIHRGHLIATGTADDLRREAGVSDADLEKVFLHMTAGE